MPRALDTTSLEAIRRKLETAFRPESLEVVDESHKHAGHAGRQGLRLGDVSHIRVRIQAASLSGMSRVAAHRAIHDKFKEEFALGLHALAIEIKR